MATAKTFTPKDVAQDLGTDGKTLRKFLRSTFPECAPGKGNRWALTSKQVKEVKKGFKVWDEKRRAPKEPTPTPEVEVDDEVEEITLEDEVGTVGDHQEEDSTDAVEDSDWEIEDEADWDEEALSDDFDADFDSGELPDFRSLDQAILEHDIDN